MSDFKLGDLVKRISDPAHDYRYMVSGEVYTITGLPTDDCESVQVNGFADYWDMDKFELYRPEQSTVEAEPTEDLQSELEEALAKIDTLESALEDAVRELISLREGNSSAVIDVDDSEFKPINEMTLEDWELAKEERWVFELNNGTEVFVQGIMDEFKDEVHPVELNDLDDSHECTVTVQGCYHSGNPEHERSIKKRIK